MADAQAYLNRDGQCPNCGSGSFRVVGPPGKVPGREDSVRYTTVIECTECRHVRGKLG